MQLITYLEHYPHYMGTMNSTATIAEEDLVLLATLVADDSEEAKEVLHEMNGEFDADGEGILNVKQGNPCAFEILLKGDYGQTPQRAANHWKQVWKALRTKGYWVGQWEEGSYGLAAPGYERKAIAAIAHLEAEIAEDTFDW